MYKDKNELDVVRVKETVMVTPNFEDHPIEIKAGWPWNDRRTGRYIHPVH
jgi:hypothetical protein